MRAILIAALSAASATLFLPACTTTPEDEQKGAVVEDRSKGGKPGVDSRTITGRDVTGTATAGKADDPRKKGVLSQRSIYYEFDKFDVKEQYRPVVEAHAKYLRENSGAKMLIQGNADERGSREYNIGLGQRRSDGVKKMMILLGARESQIESVSLGEEKPQAEGHNEEAWAKNRRSDLLYGDEY